MVKFIPWRRQHVERKLFFSKMTLQGSDDFNPLLAHMHSRIQTDAGRPSSIILGDLFWLCWEFQFREEYLDAIEEFGCFMGLKERTAV